MTRISIACMLLLCPVPWCAADDVRDDWYEIEVIIFEHKGPPGKDAESWATEPGAPAVDEAVVLAPPPGETPPLPDAGMPAGSDRMPFRRLDPDAYALGVLHNRLVVSGTHEPLLHLAWRQPANPEQPVRNVRLHAPEPRDDDTLALPPGALFIDTRAVSVQPSVDGVLSLQRSRFLHVHLDIVLAEPASERGESGLFSIFARRDTRPTAYRLQAQRRVRINEVNYFDHPVLGALVQVRPSREAIE